MRPDTADALRGMFLLGVLALPFLLAAQRPAERLGTTVYRYRVLLGLYLGTGFMTLYGGPIVLAYAAIGLAALVGISFIAEALASINVSRTAGWRTNPRSTCRSGTTRRLEC